MPCVHDFGIVEDAAALPREIRYEPERYGCVWIDDEPYLDDWWSRLALIPTFFHTPDRPGYGLARYGITLIPPESLPALEEIVLGDDRIRTDEQLVELSRVLREAIQRKKYVIHFGV